MYGNQTICLTEGHFLACDTTNSNVVHDFKCSKVVEMSHVSIHSCSLRARTFKLESMNLHIVVEVVDICY